MPAKEKLKVLVADDDLEILRIVAVTLSQDGVEVLTATDGLEALQKATAELPDAILLDISMPRLDGFAVCARLKEAPATADIPVGFLTAHDEAEFYHEAVKLEVLLYVTKPFRPERLITFIRMLLASREEPSLP